MMSQGLRDCCAIAIFGAVTVGLGLAIEWMLAHGRETVAALLTAARWYGAIIVANVVLVVYLLRRAGESTFGVRDELRPGR